MPEYVPLKEAAHRLGVHEQTLRRWGDEGKVRMVRLPGSGYRRLPAEELERLLEAMEESRPVPRQEAWLQPPSRDPEKVAEAMRLAEEVKAELNEALKDMTLEEFLAGLRGRAWSS